MLKHTFFALASLAGIAWSQEPAFTLKSYGLVGAVESVKSTHTVLASKPEDQQVTVSTQQFNEAGYLISDSFDRTNGAGKISNTYTYNAQQQILEIAEMLNGQVSAKTKYTYDEQGAISVKKVFAAGGGVKATFTFIYNEKMELARIDCAKDETYGADFSTYKSITYRYNAQKLPIEIVYDMGGYKNTTKYGYDAQGNLTEEYAISDMPGDNMNVGSYKYYTYNENRQITEIVYKNIDAKILKRESFTYDHMDQLTHHSQLTVGGKVISYVHYTSFDDEGNWLKATTYEGSKVIETEEREISYR